MRAPIASLELCEPRSLEEALHLLHDDGPLRPLAGCTDLFVGLNAGTLSARRFLNLWGLNELRYIRRDGDRLSIGALTTYAHLACSTLVQRQLPILATAARQIGGLQIQQRGTLGGNIANASPAGDTLPVLAVADATIVLHSTAGERRVPVTKFFVGYRRTVMQPDELIVAIEIPSPDGVSWFRKVGTRAAQAVSKVVIAGVRAPSPRIALGSVAPTVIRVPRTEAALAAGAPISEAVEVLNDEIQPIDDLRSTDAYRRQVAANLLRRFWEETADA